MYVVRSRGILHKEMKGTDKLSQCYSVKGRQARNLRISRTSYVDGAEGFGLLPATNGERQIGMQRKGDAAPPHVFEGEVFCRGSPGYKLSRPSAKVAATPAMAKGSPNCGRSYRTESIQVA